MRQNIRSISLFFAGLSFAVALPAQTVRFYISEGGTPAGSIDVLLRPDVAPNTVANFLAYMNAGAYTNTIFHRSVPNFIIQAGGYQLNTSTGQASSTSQNAAINGEFNLSNTPGTIAMALLNNPLTGSANTSSGTDQWFFNVTNNASSLDSQGFTVFGKITTLTGSPNGLALMTAINNLPVFTEPVPGLATSTYGNFTDIPLVNGYIDGATIASNNFVYVSSIAIVPVTTSLSFVDAASSTKSLINGIAPGELITIYGGATNVTLSNLGPATGVSFTNSSPVSTSLGGTQVLFNGVAGPMLYSSTGQVNVVAPFEIASSSTVNVVVTYNGIPSATYTFNVVPYNPGIITLNGYGTGDAAIINYRTGKVVSSSNPATAGDVLELYAEGAGVTAPAFGDGVLIGSTLPYPVNPMTLLIDGNAVPTTYIGGAPADVNGVLQVNFVVPSGLATGEHQIQLTGATAASVVQTGATLAIH